MIDSDLGVYSDTLLALALAFGLDAKNEARVAALSVSRPDLSAAQFCESVRNFYSGLRGAAAVRMFGRALPVGMAEGPLVKPTPAFESVLARKSADGQPVYGNNVVEVNDTAEPRALIRNAFTAQHDQNAILILAGPATTLARMMELPGVKQIVAAKVRYLVLAAGDFRSGRLDPRVEADPAALTRLLELWPGQVIAVGCEMNESLPLDQAALETAWAWATEHPIAEAWKQSKPGEIRTRDTVALLHAGRRHEKYFAESEPGMIRVSGKGVTEFVPSTGGRHLRLSADTAQLEKARAAAVDLIATKPTPRGPRRF